MSIPFDGWHLPGVSDNELTFAQYQLGDLTLRVPVLTNELVRRTIHHLRAARAATLNAVTTNDIVAAIDSVASRFANPDSMEGNAARTLLSAATGYSSPVIEDILQHMTHDWQRDSVSTLLTSELTTPDVLEKPVFDEATGRFTYARGPRLAFQVFSGNVPGVAVTSMVRCLLLKSAQFCKTASGEPVLPVLFARALAHTLPALAEQVAVCYWPGGSHAVEGAALGEADAVIVYGGDDAVRSIKQRTPASAKLVVHGPKLSIGIVGRSASIDVASAIAYAVTAYDQQGCVSPHVVYVEEGGTFSPKQLARAIAASLNELNTTLPRRTISAAEAMAIREARASAEFRAISGADTEVYASADTSYTVIYDADAAMQASCLNRTLYVKSIERAERIYELLQPYRGIMQSVALAGFSANQAQAMAVQLADCGVTRVTSFQHLPWPPMWWHHDGAGPLRELLTWHDVEPT